MEKITWHIGEAVVKGYVSGAKIELVFTDKNGHEHRKYIPDKYKALAHKENGKLLVSEALTEQARNFFYLHNDGLLLQNNRTNLIPKVHQTEKEKPVRMPTFLINEDGISITGKIFGNIVKFTLTNKEGVRHSGILENVGKKTLESKTKLKQRILAHVNELAQRKRGSNNIKHDNRKNIRGGSALDSASSNYADVPTYFNQSFKDVGKKKKEAKEVHSDRHYSRESDVVSIGDSITFMKDGLVRTKVLDEDENYPSYLKKLLGHRLNEVVDGMKIISIEKQCDFLDVNFAT